MPNNSSQAFKFAPVENGEKRLELTLDGDVAVIRLSSWVDGLGWCGEKTLHLDSDLLDQAHSLIGAARIRVKQRRADESDTVPTSSKVLSFPAVG